MQFVAMVVAFQPDVHQERGMNDEDTENLKQRLPHISIINEERYLYIAKPFKKCLTFNMTPDPDRRVNADCDWIWEFREKEQILFAKVEDDLSLKNFLGIVSSSDDSDDSDDRNNE